MCGASTSMSHLGGVKIVLKYQGCAGKKKCQNINILLKF